MTTPLLIAATATIIIAHLLRAMRHAMLFGAPARPRTFHLIVGLSIAYAINTLVPFRVGEVARALYVSMRAGHRFGHVAATVIAERVSDLVVVGAALSLLAIGRAEDAAAVLRQAEILALAAAIVAAGTTALRMSSRARRLLWMAGSIFNERILLTVVDFAWSTARLVTARALLHPRYVLLTALMWGSYLASYALLDRAVGIDIVHAGTAMLGKPLDALAGASAGVTGAMVLFTSVAALLILLFGLLTDGSGIRRSFRHAMEHGLPSVRPGGDVPSDAFVNPEDYRAILSALFTARRPVAAGFGLDGLDGATVHRILPGGSDAITALIEVERRLSIRKFAIGIGAEKLREQAMWLRANGDALPLARPSSERRNGERYRYDMPYWPSARDFYELVHTGSLDVSRNLLGEVIEGVGRFHASKRGGACPPEVFAAYLDRKVIANARAALDFARLHLPERYLINGDRFTLADWDRLLDREWLAAELSCRDVTSIHGDLTIDNIIICPERDPGWYLIDANPGNLFDSELIDWAKLMQSLHLGYETLNRGPAQWA